MSLKTNNSKSKPSKQTGTIFKPAAASLDNEKAPIPASPFTFHNFSAWVWNLEDDTVRLTHDWADPFAAPQNKAIETTFSECWLHVSEDDLGSLEKGVNDLRAGHSQEFDVAARLRRADKGWIWTLARGRVVKMKQGRPYLVSGINLTITRLRYSSTFQQNAIGVNSTAYHALLENSPDMIVRTDRELTPLYLNPQLGRYFKFTREEFTGYETVESVEMDPNQMDYLLHAVKKVFDEKATIREMFSFRSSWGNKVTGEYSLWPEFDTEGNVVSAVIQFRDMTEQIAAEKRARLNEARLQALNRLSQMENASEEEVITYVLFSMRELTNSSGSGIFIPYDTLDGEGRLYWSRTRDFPGTVVQREEKRVLKESFRIMMSPDRKGLFLRGIKNGDGKRIIFSHKAKDIFLRRIAAAPSIEDNRVACLAIVCNKEEEYNDSDLLQIETFINGAWLILRRFQHLRELEQAKEMAEQANITRKTFLDNVNHELRTPLASILGYTEALEGLSPEQGELRAKCLEVIHRNAEQMLQLVEDLLMLSRSEGTKPLKLEALRLRDVANCIAEEMRPQAETWNLRINVAISDKIYVYADSYAVSQVFRNLLENACRYAYPSTNIEIRARKNSKMAIVGIRDYGTGVDPDDMPHLFDRFYCGKHRGNGPHKSMGLGLPICRYILDCHGGTIWAENTPPGATFFFSLPLKESAL